MPVRLREEFAQYGGIVPQGGPSSQATVAAHARSMRSACPAGATRSSTCTTCNLHGSSYVPRQKFLSSSPSWGRGGLAHVPSRTWRAAAVLFIGTNELRAPVL